MAKQTEVLIPEEVVLNKIYLIRGHKVMLDRDLAELYGVETRTLKQQVKRNIERFREDFMFELSKEEFENWRSQFVISNQDRMGLRYAPMAFTEQGVAMLSSVLNSKRAIEVNIRIMRIYTRMREVMLTHKDILMKVEQLEKRVGKQDEKIQMIFDYLKQFITEQDKPRVQVGFKTKSNSDKKNQKKAGR